MNIYQNSICGNVLRRLREERGITQREMAARLGCAQSQVSKTESGERQLPLIETYLYSDALGMDYRVLIDRIHIDLVDRGQLPEPEDLRTSI